MEDLGDETYIAQRTHGRSRDRPPPSPNPRRGTGQSASLRPAWTMTDRACSRTRPFPGCWSRSAHGLRQLPRPRRAHPLRRRAPVLAPARAAGRGLCCRAARLDRSVLSLVRSEYAGPALKFLETTTWPVCAGTAGLLLWDPVGRGTPEPTMAWASVFSSRRSCPPGKPWDGRGDTAKVWEDLADILAELGMHSSTQAESLYLGVSSPPTRGLRVLISSYPLAWPLFA